MFWQRSSSLQALALQPSPHYSRSQRRPPCAISPWSAPSVGIVHAGEALSDNSLLCNRHNLRRSLLERVACQLRTGTNLWDSHTAARWPRFAGIPSASASARERSQGSEARGMGHGVSMTKSVHRQLVANHPRLCWFP